MTAGRLPGRDGRFNLRRWRRLRSRYRSGVARGRRVSRRSGGGLLSGVGARVGFHSLLLGGRRLVVGGVDLISGRVDACALGLTRGGDSIVLVLLRHPDGGVGKGRCPDRVLNRRLLVPGREILLGARQGRARLGRIAWRVRAGAHGFGGVYPSLRGGDGFAGAITRFVGLRGRRDGQGHGARCDERREDRFAKHDVLLFMARAVATGSEFPAARE